ncbi:MAG: hypothetical protein R2912_11355 [Eubacteriales bacterium]
MHDLSLARAYGSHALLLDGGRRSPTVRWTACFSPEHLDRAYHMDVSAWMRGLLMQWQGENEER